MPSSRTVATSAGGDHLGLVWPGGLAVIDRALGAPAATELWRRCTAEVEIGDFLTALVEVAGRSSSGLDLPGFAVALRRSSDGTTLLAARGAFVASARGEVDQAVTGTGAAPWDERRVPHAAWLAVRSAGPRPEAQEPLPVADGVVRTWRLAADLDDADPDATTTPPGVGRLPETTIVRPLAPPPVARRGRGADDASPSAAHPAGGTTDVLVPGRRCPRGHANPPAYAVCRACGAGLAGPLEQLQRPALGWMEVSTGARLELHGPVVVGRSPRPGVGGAPVELVTIPEPHVSATHVELRPDGWTVGARDLGSTNGTYLCRPGHPALRLGGEPVRLAHGDVLDLGHGARLSFHELP